MRGGGIHRNQQVDGADGRGQVVEILDQGPKMGNRQIAWDGLDGVALQSEQGDARQSAEFVECGEGDGATRIGAARVAGPDQADLESVRPGDTVAPQGQPVGGGGQVGGGRRDVVAAGMAEMRQAGDRHLQIEGRQRLAPNDHLGDAGQTAHQPGDGLPAFDDQLAAQAADFGQVAAELQGVTIALLGMGQQNLSGE